MPRRKATDGAPAAPKAPRSRKKKVNPEENKPPDAFDSMMVPNNYGIDGMEGGLYHHGEFGYVPPYGQPAPFGSPEPANSPYIIPQQSNTPQPNMIMRSMPPPQQPSQASMGASPSPLEFRIHEMNRRLYIFGTTTISEKDHAQWWDAFSHEFFDDDAKLWFLFMDDSNSQPEKYMIGRQMIPRFFRSIFESGLRDLCYVIRASTRETQTPSGCISFENEHVLQVTKMDSNMGTIEIHTECKLYAEFTPYDEILNHRIRCWTLEMRHSNELIYNETTKDYERVEQKQTRMGFLKPTISTLSLCRILEPMQLIMSNAKASGYQTDPRDCMKRTLFNYFNEMQRQKTEMTMRQMNAPPMILPAPEPEKPKATRKRQRKPATSAKAKKTAAAAAAAAAAANVAPPNASPASSNPSFAPNQMGQSFSSMAYQDVMVVGEPSMMGGDFGEEDERTISRVENSQYDPNALQMQQLGQGPPQQMGVNGPNMAMGPPQSQMGGMNQQGMTQMNQQGMTSNMQNVMNNSMQNTIPNSIQNTMPNSIPSNQMLQMQNPMHGNNNNQHSGQSNGTNIPVSMAGGIPLSMPSGMPNQMPGGMSNSMPPGYNYQPPSQWQQPANSAMITG